MDVVWAGGNVIPCMHKPVVARSPHGGIRCGTPPNPTTHTHSAQEAAPIHVYTVYTCAVLILPARAVWASLISQARAMLSTELSSH